MTTTAYNGDGCEKCEKIHEVRFRCDAVETAAHASGVDDPFSAPYEPADTKAYLPE